MRQTEFFIQIFVNTPFNDVLSLKGILYEMSVLKLKAEIELRTAIPGENQNLYFIEQCLDNHLTLREAGIRNGCILRVRLKEKSLEQLYIAANQGLTDETFRLGIQYIDHSSATTGQDIEVINDWNNKASEKAFLALFSACHSGSVSLVNEIIKKSAVNLDQVSVNGRSALHISAFRGSIGCICVLLSEGIDATTKDEEDKTALDIASENGYIHCEKKLWLYQRSLTNGNWRPIGQCKERKSLARGHSLVESDEQHKKSEEAFRHYRDNERRKLREYSSKVSLSLPDIRKHVTSQRTIDEKSTEPVVNFQPIGSATERATEKLTMKKNERDMLPCLNSSLKELNLNMQEEIPTLCLDGIEESNKAKSNGKIKGHGRFDKAAEVSESSPLKKIRGNESLLMIAEKYPSKDLTPKDAVLCPGTKETLAPSKRGDKNQSDILHRNMTVKPNKEKGKHIVMHLAKASNVDIDDIDGIISQYSFDKDLTSLSQMEPYDMKAGTSRMPSQEDSLDTSIAPITSQEEQHHNPDDGQYYGGLHEKEIKLRPEDTNSSVNCKEHQNRLTQSSHRRLRIVVENLERNRNAKDAFEMWLQKKLSQRKLKRTSEISGKKKEANTDSEAFERWLKLKKNVKHKRAMSSDVPRKNKPVKYSRPKSGMTFEEWIRFKRSQPRPTENVTVESNHPARHVIPQDYSGVTFEEWLKGKYDKIMGNRPENRIADSSSTPLPTSRAVLGIPFSVWLDSKRNQEKIEIIQKLNDKKKEDFMKELAKLKRISNPGIKTYEEWLLSKQFEECMEKFKRRRKNAGNRKTARHEEDSRLVFDMWLLNKHVQEIKEEEEKLRKLRKHGITSQSLH